MTNKDKMLSGKIYDPNNIELVSLRNKAHKLCRQYNELDDEEIDKREKILHDMGVKFGKNTFILGPIYFDYGCFIEFGDNCFANFNLTILDTCPVRIGNNVFIGPGVSIVAPVHPLRYQERNLYISKNGSTTDKEYGKPIIIEDNCWIASNVTICGGVVIGSGSVIGAGSVVTRSIAKNSLAVGNPCKVIREITEQDKIKEELL